MNLHIKTGLGIKNYVLDPNSNVEYEIFLTDFSWQLWAKNTKLNFTSESVKTKEHKESNSCEKYYFLIDAFYKINFWPILKLLQKNRFSSFSTFWNNCPCAFLNKVRTKLCLWGRFAVEVRRRLAVLSLLCLTSGNWCRDVLCRGRPEAVVRPRETRLL